MENDLRNGSSSGCNPIEPALQDQTEKSDLRPNGPHGMALNRPFGLEESEKKISDQSSCEFHLTVRFRYTLTDRQCSLLLDVLNYQALTFGISFNMYLAIWTLYSRLLGSSKNASEVENDITKVTVMVSELILRSLHKHYFNLSPGSFVHLPEHLKEILSPGLMSKRTYGSRFIAWRPEHFLEILTVPVEHQFLDSERFSIPYSSYCKGYGESHPSTHRHKTRFSAELDVDVSKVEQLEEQELLVRSVHPKHVLSEVLRNRYDLFLEGKF